MNKTLRFALIVYVAIFALSKYVYVGLFKVFWIPITISGITLFATYFKRILLKDYKDYLKQRDAKMKLHHDKVSITLHNKDKSNYESVVKPMYEATKNLFAHMLKTKQLSRGDIIELKALINRNLGTFNDYYRSYTFENDAKEIYVKLRNYNLSKSNFEEILNFLNARLEEETYEEISS